MRRGLRNSWEIEMGRQACASGPIGSAFAAQMRQARDRHRVSQRQLEDLLVDHGWPLAASAINAIENGHRRITLDDAVAIASVLIMALPVEIAKLFKQCGTCQGEPPSGFACTTCGTVGVQS